MISFDIHELSINEYTPRVRDKLLAHFDSDTTYTDMEKDYQIYEILEDIEKNQILLTESYGWFFLVWVDVLVIHRRNWKQQLDGPHG